MRAIVLAAGRGTRLRPLTDASPKCLLAVGANTILERAVRMLADHGVRRITVVVGFREDLVRAALGAAFPVEWFTFVRNEVFDRTNNAYSLWLARAPADEPVLLIDSDIVFDPAVLRLVGESSSPNRLALRTRGDIGAEDIKVSLTPDGSVADIGKHVPLAAAAGESIGIEVFSAELTERLWGVLEHRVVVEQRVDEWYEAAFAQLIREGARIQAVDLGLFPAIEVDTLADLEYARRLFAPDAGASGPAAGPSLPVPAASSAHRNGP